MTLDELVVTIRVNAGEVSNVINKITDGFRSLQKAVDISTNSIDSFSANLLGISVNAFQPLETGTLLGF